MKGNNVCFVNLLVWIQRGDHRFNPPPPTPLLWIFKGMGFEMVKFCLTDPGVNMNPPPLKKNSGSVHDLKS